MLIIQVIQQPTAIRTNDIFFHFLLQHFSLRSGFILLCAGGYVLPFAIDYSTIVYGEGCIFSKKGDTDDRKATIVYASAMTPDELKTSKIDESSTPPDTTSWTTYVEGTVFQYLKDLPKGCELIMNMTIAGDVPPGSGLSSSASLEIAVARFVEAVLGEHAFSSCCVNENQRERFSPAKERALRCQTAENQWCNSPCGIMDQAISSAANSGNFLFIDCRSLDFTPTKMAKKSLNAEDPLPVIVVANSNVKHSIGGGEYPIRVAQCKTATEALQKIRPDIHLLRDATMADLDSALSNGCCDNLIYKRARHVITENERTVQAKRKIELGDWKSVGELMNSSHASMRDDYEVSCDEVDKLVEIAQNFSGVYGSRLTGGGFGGCTVTLVAADKALDLIQQIKTEYLKLTGVECPCFITKEPCRGTHLLSFTDFRPLAKE